MSQLKKHTHAHRGVFQLQLKTIPTPSVIIAHGKCRSSSTRSVLNQSNSIEKTVRRQKEEREKTTFAMMMRKRERERERNRDSGGNSSSDGGSETSIGKDIKQ